MNGWIAGNSTGKSTIFKAIIWGLTGMEHSFKLDVRSWIEDVALEVDIAGDIFTLRYFPRTTQPKVTGLIVQCDLDTLLQNSSHVHPLYTFSGTRDMQEKIDVFFSKYLDFVPLQWVQDESFQQDGDVRKISWLTYAQALFIGSDYTDYLFPNTMPGKPHQKTLSVYLGLGLTEVLSKLEVERGRARGEYHFETRRVHATGQRIQDTITSYEAEMQRLEESIHVIDTGQSVLVDPSYQQHIQDQLAHHMTHYVEISDIFSQFLKEERRIQRDIEEIQRRMQALREAIQFKVFFSGLDLERCPHCEQPVAPERITEEQMKKLCRLCRNEFHPIISVEQYEILLQDSIAKESELEQSLQKISKDIHAKNKEQKSIESELTKWRQALHDLPRQEQVGLHQELRGLIDRRAYLRGQLKQLRLQAEEVHSQCVDELKLKQDIFSQALIIMQDHVWKNHAHYLRTLEQRIMEFATLFGVSNLENVSFNFVARSHLTVLQGGRPNRFQDMEVSEKLRIKLAVHLALLSVRTIERIGRHPGLLMIDAPGSAEMDETRFQSILQGLLNIKDQLGDQIQLLIASTRGELASICEEEQIEIRKEGEVLF